jgi:hypothetical protein
VIVNPTLIIYRAASGSAFAAACHSFRLRSRSGSLPLRIPQPFIVETLLGIFSYRSVSSTTDTKHCKLCN